MRTWAAATIALLLLLLLSAVRADQPPLEGFDEPEQAQPKRQQPPQQQQQQPGSDQIPIFEGGAFMDSFDAATGGAKAAEASAHRVGSVSGGKKKQPTIIGMGSRAATDKGSGGATDAAGAAGDAPTRPPPRVVLVNYWIEAGAALCVVAYVAMIFVGMQRNNKIGEAWARAFAMPGGLFDRNFAYRGPKETGALLMRDSANVFKFYASGRRYCQGLLAELQLLARQDAISMVWQLLSPSEDLIKLEVFMHEATMPPIVLAIATPKHARSMQRDMLDIVRYTKRIHVSKDVFPAGDKLWILAEHSSIFQDLFSDPRIQQIFSFAGPSGGGSIKYFRSMHFTSENSEGTHKQVLRFVFKLPPRQHMDALAGMMELVPMFIDVVGTYKLPVDLRKRAIDARAKQAEDDEELRRKRQEALQQKRAEKAQEERARLLRMNPEQRQKAEEKMQRQMAKKAMKSKTVRM